MDTMNTAVAVVETLPELLHDRPRPKGTTRNRKPTTKAKRRSRAGYKYIEVNDMGRTVGIEVTFIPGGFEKEDQPDISDLTSALKKPFDYRIRKALSDDDKISRKLLTNSGSFAHPTHTGLYKGVTLDPQCIECPTAPTANRKRLYNTLDALYSVADSLHMVPSTDWHGGGGAHIHVGRKADEHKDMDMYMGLVATAHPYMTWAFMNYGDDNQNARPHCLANTTANKVDAATVEMYRARWYKRIKAAEAEAAHYYTSAERRKAYVSGETSAAKRTYVTAFKAYLKQKRNAVTAMADVWKGIPRFSKCFAIATRDYGKHGTWEFRLFRAPDDAAGHIRQLNFALAYTEYCERLIAEGKEAPTYFATIEEAHKAFPYMKAVREFNALLRTLGLNPRHYRADVENMRKYYELHKLGMGDTVAQVQEKGATQDIVSVTLPRRLFARKHRVGTLPGPYVRPSRGQRRKAARAARLAAEAAKLAAEARAAEVAAMIADGKCIPRSKLLDIAKVGDKVTVYSRREYEEDEITSFEDTHMQDRFNTYQINTRKYGIMSGWGMYYTGTVDPSMTRIVALNGIPVLGDNETPLYPQPTA